MLSSERIGLLVFGGILAAPIRGGAVLFRGRARPFGDQVHGALAASCLLARGAGGH